MFFENAEKIEKYLVQGNSILEEGVKDTFINKENNLFVENGKEPWPLCGLKAKVNGKDVSFNEKNHSLENEPLLPVQSIKKKKKIGCLKRKSLKAF